MNDAPSRHAPRQQPAGEPAHDCPPGLAPATGRALVIAVAVLALLVALSLAGEWSTGGSPSPLLRALDIAVAVVGCVVMAGSLRWPVATTVSLGVLGTLSGAATPLAGTAVLWLASRQRLPVAFGVAGVAVAGQVARALWRPVVMPLQWWAVFNLAIFAAVVGWGAMARARQAVIASLRERARRAEADQARRADDARRAERARIAREMHDVLAHRLSLLATYAGAMEYRPDAPPDQLRRAATEIRSSARRALEELRGVIGVLRDDDVDDGTTGRARPQPTLSDVPELIDESRAAGMTVQLDDTAHLFRTTGGAAEAHDGGDAPDRGDTAVPDTVGRTVYRVVQEALTNARRHAPGQPVRVHLSGRPGAGLVVEVTNPVTPPQPAAARDTRAAAAAHAPAGPTATAAQAPAGTASGPPGAGNGLIGLAERVTLAGGSLEHGVTAPAGFRVRASLPWSA